ncbi:phosphoserine aminotransferase apoenzyme [Granulicella pectinivorans]|uniref:phosphoserine transaminase n=1 Tax=Granulicella pectinivorans TaxID=474950 RepID=A0A1I6MDA0_9BACT|nr:phosphoserine transaminase [Granulicella pectinivorans]SFS13726.1 phosphoserine aminotransferase apoenzyme [Granulicella pectinivorans]
MKEQATRPAHLPINPHFSSGPCAKRPGWSLSSLHDALVGRSHRSKRGKAKLEEVIELSREILGIPSDYRIGIVPGSDTGAIEMALWSMLGARGVDVLAWESFGKEWVTDITKQLKLEDVRVFEAAYGELPKLDQADAARDIVFTWNGTTSGVRVPNGDWISEAREGLTFCDATSAVFAMDMPWKLLDVTTWSWQKVLGGEGAHGMIVLSPRAVERLTSYKPPRPLPKIFRLAKGSELIEGIFSGETINTPSMLAVEDALDGLRWAKSIGGLDQLIARSKGNLKAISDWQQASSWVAFLATDPATRSSTSICLAIKDPDFLQWDSKKQAAFLKSMTGLVEKEGAGFDIASYRDAPLGLRIWGGATVETSDIACLLEWLDYAFITTKSSMSDSQSAV